MKKGLLFILALFLTINLVCALDITLTKDSYQPSETLQAEITGSFISLSLNNILIYEQETPRSQPVVSDLTKQGNVYYFYAILPNQEGNYSIRIENAKYTELGKEKSDTITKEFKVIRTNSTSLQINPGFIATSTDFSITLKSINSNQDISAIFDQQSKNLSLIEDVQKTISFQMNNLSGKQTLKVSGYSIPVFIIEKSDKPITTLINQTNETINQTGINQTTNVSDLNKTEIEEYVKNLGETKSLSCSKLGVICLEGQECNGEIILALEANCCVGACVKAKESSMGKIIGVILVILMIAVLGYIYWKSKKKLKPKSTSEILKSKEKDFQTRMQEQGSEVTRSLGRI
ncbi:MAG: hypothetical protein WCX73_03700 [Candidatus Pacearchaeota archaeon]|jgi:hypothetical protein